MKILQIHKFHHIEGGAERYYLDLSKSLQKRGHTVANFSMHDPSDERSRWDSYFLSHVSFRKVDIRNGLKVIGRMIYSLEAKQKINQLLDDFRPDIVHIHNIYNHISPSILPEIKKRGIPVVQTVHDYSNLAPNYYLFHRGQICEITKKSSYYKAIFHKCVKNSYLASFLTVMTMYIHKIFGLYSKNIDLYIAPSHFMKQKMIEYGFDEKKITVVPHFVLSKNIKKSGFPSKNKYILYFGRLSPEKGLFFLLDVIKTLPSVKFNIVGEGPQKQLLKEKTKRLRLKNVTFTGFLQGKRLTKEISNSYSTILPSIWYDNLPYSILESFALGKPVVASRIGGIPEMVKDGITGYRFEPNNLEDCRKKILKLWNDPKLVEKMGKNCKSIVKNLNLHKHCLELIKIYQSLL